MPADGVPSFIESTYTTRVEYEAWVKTLKDGGAAPAPPAAAAAAEAAAASAGFGGGGLLSDPGFWSTEKGAPLLRRNAGLIPLGELLPDDVAARVAGWPSLCGADVEPDPPLEPCTPDESAERIFMRDAERTFISVAYRARMIGLLRRVWPITKDYHQGMGYVASLLLLFFDEVQPP